MFKSWFLFLFFLLLQLTTSINNHGRNSSSGRRHGFAAAAAAVSTTEFRDQQQRRLDFAEEQFRSSVTQALTSMELILNTTRRPIVALDDLDHTYDDKYTLVEVLTNTWMASMITILEQFYTLGMQQQRRQQQQQQQDHVLVEQENDDDEDDDVVTTTNELFYKSILPKIVEWVTNQDASVLLVFETKQSCTLEKEVEDETIVEERQVETMTSETINNWYGSSDTQQEKAHTETVKVKTTTLHYHWKVATSYRLYFVRGRSSTSKDDHVDADDDDSMIHLFHQEDLSTIIITSGGNKHGRNTRNHPRPPIENKNRIEDVNLTWLFQRISTTIKKHDDADADKNSKAGQHTTNNVAISQFAIDRLDDACKTPSRNPNIHQALEFKQQLFYWTNGVANSMMRLDNSLSGYKQRHSDQVPFKDRSLSSLFVPIIPFFDETKINSTSRAVLSQLDINQLLHHHQNQLRNLIQKHKKDNIMSVLYGPVDYTVVTLCYHLRELLEQYGNAISSVEFMLEKQLVHAIGKVLVADDFDQYMKHHNQQYFLQDYSPKPFSYAVRRPNRYPDGMISIERKRAASFNSKHSSYTQDNQNLLGDPIETLVRHIPASLSEEKMESPPPPSSIYLPVSAATKVEIQGDKYLHGWIQHGWYRNIYRDPKQQHQYELVARAQQFSSFLLVLGVMSGPDTFIPKEALIVQNKDHVIIPLLMNVLPSAKDFKDAISSLSQEQRKFAQAYRNMQLESSVFGVCIIQIKPQLERLLNLPEGALAKEIQLTQDLMSLFVEYQIPSDLVSYDDGIPKSQEGTSYSETDVSTKLAAVKGHVQAVLDVIENAKKKQMEEETRRASMRNATSYNPTPQSSSTPTASPSSYHPVAGPSAAPSDSAYAARSGITKDNGGDKIRTFAAESRSPKYTLMSDGSAPESSRTQEGYPTDTTTTKTKSSSKSSADASVSATFPGDDFTLLPKILDAKFEKYDADGSLQSTVIAASKDNWTRGRQENLLLPMTQSHLESSTIAAERLKAMDLLTALSRSGSLPVSSCELHIIIGVTHSFERDIMGTLLRDNINPIEKVEQSMLLIASTIHGVESPASLIAAPGEGMEVE